MYLFDHGTAAEAEPVGAAHQRAAAGAEKMHIVGFGAGGIRRYIAAAAVRAIGDLLKGYVSALPADVLRHIRNAFPARMEHCGVVRQVMHRRKIAAAFVVFTVLYDFAQNVRSGGNAHGKDQQRDQRAAAYTVHFACV